MNTASIYYVKGLREIELEPQADHRIVEAVRRINEAYKRIGLDYTLKLVDIGSFLNELRDEDLCTIAQQTGRRKDLTELIQSSISFEEARAKEGIFSKYGEWYKGDEKLKPVKLDDVDIDEVNSRFIKRLDITRLAKRIYKENKISMIDGISFEEWYPKYLKDTLRSFSHEPATHDISQLEATANDVIREAYARGDIKPFNFNALTVHHIFMDILDRCAMYINLIQNPNKREREFRRFLQIMNAGIRRDSKGNYIRVLPSLGYEGEVGEYPYMETLSDFLWSRQTETAARFIILDTYLPQFYIRCVEPKVYHILRHNNHPSIGCPGNLGTMTIESVQFVLLHEFAHKIAGAKDIEELDSESDSRLMLAPLHYTDFNHGKLSDNSIREAYKAILK